MSDNFGVFIKKHKIIGLDSMLFIYHFEKHKAFWQKTKKVFELLEKGKFSGITSVITLIEILTKPKKENNYYLVKEYKELLTTFPHLEISDVNLEIGDLASSLRAKYNLTTPDAILLASSLNSKASGFITSDIRLKKVKEIEVFVLTA
jgi:predicted nucleic acid-binding protein